MVKAAPPAFVVAMVASMMWIPWALFAYTLDVPGASMHYVTFGTAITIGSQIVLIGATAELAKRTRGTVRAALVISMMSWVLVLVIAMGGQFLVMKYADRVSFDRGFRILDWARSALWLTAWLGFSLAGWSSRRGTAIATFAFSFVLEGLPPVREHLFSALEPWMVGLTYMIAQPVRSVFATQLAGAIARRAHDPARDHRVAARHAKVIAFSCIVLALVELASAAATRMISEEVDLRLGFFIATLAGSILLGFGLWRLAQQQLPALPRYRIHVAALAAIYSAVMIGETFTFTSRGMTWEMSDSALHVPWWYLMPATLALACLVTVLGRYSKHRRAVKPSTAIGGALFTAGVVGWIVLRDDGIAGPICLAVAYIALVPALVRASRELSTDRVETTADVFA